MSTSENNTVEQIVDERMNALVENYIGTPDGIPKNKIQETLEAADDMRRKMMEKCYQEVGTGQIDEIAQPDKIVGTGKFKQSNLDKIVDKVMEGKENISVPKFKETVWQKIKNALHIGKGHEARKQEHIQKFAKENIKPGIPKDILDKAKSIGKEARKTTSENSPEKRNKNQVGRNTGSGRAM